MCFYSSNKLSGGGVFKLADFFSHRLDTFLAPLFSGFRNHYQVRQASLAVKESQLKLQETTQQLELAAEVLQEQTGNGLAKLSGRCSAPEGLGKLFQADRKGLFPWGHSFRIYRCTQPIKLLRNCNKPFKPTGC
jgi:hypothetical protein